MPDLDSTGLSGDETAPTLTRSTRIWFEDGNVVLRAQNTVFRVYKGILSRDSSVFRYMFSLPNLENAETYDVSGCPLVVVQDDAADMELYLTLIFDPKCVTGPVAVSSIPVLNMLSFTIKLLRCTVQPARHHHDL